MLNKGWFIPAIIAGAAACSIALWIYLSTSNEPIAARFSRIPPQTRVANSALPRPDGSQVSPQNVDSRKSDDAVDLPDSVGRHTAFRELNSRVTGTPTDSPHSAPEPTAPAEARRAPVVAAANPDRETGILSSAAADQALAREKERRRESFRHLRSAIESRVYASLDRIDFTLMELDRHALRWRSNISRDPWYVTLHAWLQFHADDIDGADRSFLRALELREDYPAALRGRAIAMMSAGRYHRAADAFRELIDVYPNDVDGRYNLGVLLSRVGRFREAGDAYRAALDVDPKHARSLYNLAAIAQRDGRLADARRRWIQFTEIEPNVISVWFNLGVVQMDYKEPLEAAVYFKAAVSINPDELVGRVNLALAYLEAAHIEEAERVLREADADMPCEPAVLDALVETNRRLAEWSPSQRHTFLARASEIESELIEMRPPDIEFEQVAGDPMNGEASRLIGP